MSSKDGASFAAIGRALVTQPNAMLAGELTASPDQKVNIQAFCGLMKDMNGDFKANFIFFSPAYLSGRYRSMGA